MAGGSSFFRSCIPPKLIPPLQRFVQAIRLKSFHSRIIERSYLGVPLRLLIADPIGQHWYEIDWDEGRSPEIELLVKGRLKPGARVFDLGAHQAVVAHYLAIEVGPSGQVIALEPHPHNLSVACKNRSLNNTTQLEIVPGIVAERSGEVAFSANLNGSLASSKNSGRSIIVRSYTIDELSDIWGVPDVLYIDVEGAECLALAGAERTLRSNPDVFIEVHINEGLEELGGSAEQVFSLFDRYLYDCYVRKQSNKDFTPLATNTEILDERFFFLAINKHRSTEAL